MTRRRAAIGVIAAALTVATAGTARTQDITASATDLLEYYNLRKYDSVAKALVDANRGDLGIVLDALKLEADRWVLADGADFVAHRRMVLATFALEVASAGLETQWERSKQILEWTCARLRKEKTVDQNETTWFEAALALTEGARDLDALRVHIAHMTSRVPNAPRLTLAQAFVAETEYWDDVMMPSIPGASRVTPDAAAKALERALAQPATRAEAHLRLGYFLSALNRPDEALVHLQQVDPIDDPGQRYLAQLFAGWIHERRKDHPAAVAAFTAAVAAVPKAPVASTALALRLYSAGERSEAQRVMQDATGASPPVVDPWRIYGYGDLRRFPYLLARLQGQLR